jgi:hypothetical protein
MPLYADIKLLGLLGSKVTYRAINQLKPCLNCAAAYLGNFVRMAYALDAFVGPKVKIHLVHTINCLLCKLRPNELGQVTPNLI